MAKRHNKNNQFLIFEFTNHTIIADAIPPKARELSSQALAPLTRVFAINKKCFQVGHDAVLVWTAQLAYRPT